MEYEEHNHENYLEPKFQTWLKCPSWNINAPNDIKGVTECDNKNTKNNLSLLNRGATGKLL